MTLKEFCNGKNYPYIKEFIKFKLKGKEVWVFSGIFKVIDGEVKSLDGDTYDINMEYVSYEEYIADHDHEEGYYKKGDTLLKVIEED